MKIESDQLMSELNALAAFSDAPAPAVTRVLFSLVDRMARAYVQELCAGAGLKVRQDGAGNIFARWEGREPGLPAVATGSHIDAIPYAGRYDGTVGVLGGLEAIRALQREGVRPRRSIELILFSSEEPTRYGIGCLGSRLMSKSLDPIAADRLKDREGKTLEELRREAGYWDSLTDVPLPKGHYSAFVELHIEQGPLLEQAKIPLGVVTAIAGPAGVRIFLEGEGGHAGAVLMPDRRDTFPAAAEIGLALERAAKESGAIDTVATVGVCELFPGAINSIPGRVRMEADIRDTDLGRRDHVLKTLEATCKEVGARRKIKIRTEIIHADAPAHSDPAIVEALVKSCESLGLPHLKMVSRAYHDTMFMSRIAPVAMLFIPCLGGVSHRPDEYASPEDIERGVLTLAHTLARLAE